MTWNKTITFIPGNDWAATEPTEAEYFRIRSINPPRAGKFLLAQVEFNDFNLSIENLTEIPATTDYINIKLPKSEVMTDRRIGIIQIEDYNSKDWAVELWELPPAEPPPPPPTPGIMLNYQSNGDTNGVFYLAGKNWDSGTAWQEPHTRGSIQISVSSNGNPAQSISFPLSSFTDRQGSGFYSENLAGQWIAVDLKTKKLKPTKYTLQNRNTTEYGSLRNWAFQGWDGTTWLTLNSQSNNTTLDTISEWIAIDVSTESFFSKFRLLQTGVNSAGQNWIALGEWEIYGDLKDI